MGICHKDFYVLDQPSVKCLRPLHDKKTDSTPHNDHTVVASWSSDRYQITETVSLTCLSFSQLILFVVGFLCDEHGLSTLSETADIRVKICVQDHTIG